MAADLAGLVALFQRGAFDEVIARAAQLGAQHPREPFIPVITGAAHAERAAWTEAEAAFHRAIAIAPDLVDAHYNLGLALQRQGKPAAAEPAYRTALRLAPQHHHAANNLAVVLREQGRLEEARVVLTGVLAVQPDFVDALVNHGITLKHLGEPDAARTALEAAVARDPACAEGWYNLGVVLADQQALAAAADAFGRAAALAPHHRAAHANHGQALANLGRLEEAAAAYERGLATAPDDPQAWTGLGLVWLDRGDPARALAAWDRALAADPDYHRALGLKRFNQLCQGDWSGLGPIPAPPEGKGAAGSVGSPLSFIALVDDPALHRRIAEQTTAQTFAAVKPVPFAPEPGKTARRLRIAYLSADFNNHPVAQLMAGVLAAHDRERFEVFALAHSLVPPDAMTERVAGSTEHFIDVAAMNDQSLAALARHHRFDVAIDLTGHTRGTRTAALAHRLAPVQIAHLGYPGTIGAPFIDYLVADRHVIPPAERVHYVERLLLMPGSFQPNDDQRPLAAQPLARADFGLPERGFVFCCFNNTYKITAAEWDVWMGLLGAVPGSVLWLSRPVVAAEAAFRREAAARGIDPARLVFADKADYSVHLARHGLADLFLDTFTYNAHTTASDALWGGLPVLTVAGRSFAARVAASALHAAGLPELVTTTTADYTALALALAREPARLGALRARLAANRTTCALFDTRRYTRNFEKGLAMAVRRAREGLPPEDLVIEDSGD